MPKLTELGLKALTGNDAGRTLFDTGGLRGETRANDAGVSVAFSYRYRFDGKSREIRCGTWPHTSLRDIRTQRDAARALLNQGIDPSLARRREREEQLQEQREAATALHALSLRPTVREVFEDWHRKEASRRSDSGVEVRRAFEKDVLPGIGGLYADEITRRHIVKVLDDVKERGVTRYANVLLQYVRQMFRFAALREIVPGDPTFGLVKKNVGGEERERERYLTETEILELAAKLPQAGLTEMARAALWIMLSTCCRIGEISRARWSDVDFDLRLWTIPVEHAKNKRAHAIHLSAFAIRHFEILKSLAAHENWVFPSRDGSGHISTKSLQKQFYDRQRDTPMKGRSRKSATLILTGGEWCAHDLRRTGATLMGELGVRSDVIERCLNHVGEDKLRKTYQRQELIAERIEAFQKLGDRLEMLAPGNANIAARARRLSVQPSIGPAGRDAALAA